MAAWAARVRFRTVMSSMSIGVRPPGAPLTWWIRWMQRSMTAIFARTTSRSTMSHPPHEGPLRLSPDDADVLVPARQVGTKVDAPPAIRVGDQPARHQCLKRDNRRGRVQNDHVGRTSGQSNQIGARLE